MQLNGNTPTQIGIHGRIAECFEEYHTALADLQGAHAIPMSNSRSSGI
jgi:hypothetical protein